MLQSTACTSKALCNRPPRPGKPTYWVRCTKLVHFTLQHVSILFHESKQDVDVKQAKGGQVSKLQGAENAL